MNVYKIRYIPLDNAADKITRTASEYHAQAKLLRLCCLELRHIDIHSNKYHEQGRNDNEGRSFSLKIGKGRTGILYMGKIQKLWNHSKTGTDV